MQDHFKDRAKIWDSGSVRVNGALIIADAISKEVELHSEMEIMDFGVGTGLLGFEIAKNVKKVYGVDTSKEMIKKLHENKQYQKIIEDVKEDIQDAMSPDSKKKA